MKRDVIVIGGGVIGLMCAYFLNKSGKSVTVVDEGNIQNSTSFGNAGLLSSFDKSPLSYPGVFQETLKLMLKGESPVKVHPTLDMKLYKWLIEFLKSADAQKVKKTMELFEKYGGLAIDLYKKIQDEDKLDFDLHHDGLLMIYTEEKSFDKKVSICKDDESRFEILDVKDTLKYMPCANEKIKGSVLLKKNAHVDPRRIMEELKRHLKESGVEIVLDEKIIDIEKSGDKITKVHSVHNSYEASTFVMATGYKLDLAKKMQKDFMMVPAKGYSITFDMPEELRPKMSSLFADMFIAMTPRRDNVRITSKLELGSTDPNVVKAQIDSIRKNFKDYTVDFEMKNEKLWCGFRPLTPNDIPILGRDDNYSNFVYATGLGWLGITFASSIGHIIDDLISNEKSNSSCEGVHEFSAIGS